MTRAPLNDSGGGGDGGTDEGSQQDQQQAQQERVRRAIEEEQRILEDDLINPPRSGSNNGGGSSGSTGSGLQNAQDQTRSDVASGPDQTQSQKPERTRGIDSIQEVGDRTRTQVASGPEQPTADDAFQTAKDQTRQDVAGITPSDGGSDGPTGSPDDGTRGGGDGGGPEPPTGDGSGSGPGGGGGAGGGSGTGGLPIGQHASENDIVLQPGEGLETRDGRMGEQATKLENDWLAKNPEFSASDVAIVPGTDPETGDPIIRTKVSESALRREAAEDFEEEVQGADFTAEDVAVTINEDGEWEASLTESGKAELQEATQDRASTIFGGLGVEGTQESGLSLPEVAGSETFREQAAEQALTGLGFEGVDTDSVQAPDAAGSETFQEQRADTAKIGLGFEGVDTGAESAPDAPGSDTLREQAAEQALTGLGFEGVDTGELRAPTETGAASPNQPSPGFTDDVAQQKLAAAVREQEAGEDARGRAFAEMTPMEKLGADVPDDEPRPVEFVQGDDGGAKLALFGEKDDIPSDRQLSFGVALTELFSQSDLGQAVDASATELTPHVGMTAGDNEKALLLRAEKEKRMAELAESGWEDLTSGRAPSGQERGGLLFQSSEIVERYLGEKAHDLEQASPTHDPAPGEQLGDVPGNVFGGILGGISMGVGAVGQLGPSVAFDLEQQAAGEETASSELGTGGLAKNTAESQVKMFRDRPGSSSILIGAPTVGRGITSFETGYAAGVGRPSYTGRVPRPTVEAVDTGDTTGYTAGIKWGSGKVESGRPVVSAVKGGEGRTPFELGRFEATVGETAPTPRGPLETSIVDFTLGGKESTRIKSFRETQAETQYSGLRPGKLESYVGDVLESHGGPREAAPDVIKLVKQDEGALYGSLTQKAASKRVGEPGVTRTPRDIDVADLSSKSDFAKRVTEAVNERAGEEVVRVEDGTPTSVETGSKIFDLHEAEAPQPGSYFASDASFGVNPEAAIKSTEGVRTTTLSEQTARKGQGAMDVLSLEPREVGDVRSTLAPEHAGRVKDIGDFYTGEMANIRGLEARGKPRRASKARESLESWLETWGEDISTKVRRDYETYGVDDAALLGDFSGFSKTESAPAPSTGLTASAGASSLPSDGLSWNVMDVSTVGTRGSGSPSSFSPTGSSSRWNPFSSGGGTGSGSAGAESDLIADTSGSRARSDRPGSGGGVFDSPGLFTASTGTSDLFSETSPPPTGSGSDFPTGSAPPSGSSFFSPGTTSGDGSPSGGSTPPSSTPPSLSFPTGSSIFSPGSSVPPANVPSFPGGSSPPPGGNPIPGGSMPPSKSANQSDSDDHEWGGLIPVNTPFVNPIVGGQQALTADFAGITQSLPGFGAESNNLEEAMDVFTGGWGGNDR